MSGLLLALPRMHQAKGCKGLDSQGLSCLNLANGNPPFEWTGGLLEHVNEHYGIMRTPGTASSLQGYWLSSVAVGDGAMTPIAKTAALP